MIYFNGHLYESTYDSTCSLHWWWHCLPVSAHATCVAPSTLVVVRSVTAEAWCPARCLLQLDVSCSGEVFGAFCLSVPLPRQDIHPLLVVTSVTSFEPEVLFLVCKWSLLARRTCLALCQSPITSTATKSCLSHTRHSSCWLHL